ncbi:MAG: hypothetical protein JWM27_3690, partial [Gemmatimonadetes bacterium]|nr:hypothetical protein [Gemmatimonadota bacterium]
MANDPDLPTFSAQVPTAGRRRPRAAALAALAAAALGAY